MFPYNVNRGGQWSTIQHQQPQQQQQHQQQIHLQQQVTTTNNESHNDLSSSDTNTMTNFFTGYGGNVGGATNLGSSSNNHHPQQQQQQNTTSDGLHSSSGSGLGFSSIQHRLANTSGHSQPQQASNQSHTLFSNPNIGPYLDLFSSDSFSSLFSPTSSSTGTGGSGSGGVGLPNQNNHHQPHQLGNSITINSVSSSNNGINDGNSSCWSNKQSVIGHHQQQQQQQQQFNPSGNLFTRGLNMTQDEQSYYTPRVDPAYGSNFNSNFTTNPLTSDVLKQTVDTSINPLGLNNLTRRSNNNNINNKTPNDPTSHHPFSSIQASSFNSSLNVANSNLITSNIGRVGPIHSSVGTTNSILASVSDCANVVGNLDPMGHHADQLPSVSTHLNNLTMSSNGGPSTSYNNSTPSNKRLESQPGSTLQSNSSNLRSATHSLNNGTSSGVSNDHSYWTKQVIGPTLTSTLGNQSYGVDDSSSSYFTRDNRGLAHEDTFFSATTAGVQKQVETNMANLILNQLGSSNSSNNSNDHLFQSAPSRSSSAIGTPYACGNNSSAPTNSANSVGSGVINSVFNVGIGLSVGNSNNSLGITGVSSPPNANNNSVAPTPSSNVVAAHVIGRASGSIRSSTPISNFPVNNADSVNSSTDSAFESGATSGQRLDTTTGLNTGSPSLSSSSGDIGETKKPSWASVASQPAKPVVKPKLMPSSNVQQSKQPVGLNNMENIGTWDSKTDGNLSSISNTSTPNQIGLSHGSNTKSNDGSSSVPNSWASPPQQGNRIVNKNSANVTNPSTLTASNGNVGLTSTNASLNMKQQQGTIKNSSSMNHNGQTTGETAYDANGSGNTSDLNRSKPTNLWSYNGLRVVNVSTSCSKSALVSLFSKFGRVKNIERINTSKTSELSIWVYYDNPNSPVEAAAKLQAAVVDNVSLDGLPLRIHFAPTDDQKDLKFSRPKQPPDNKGECYYWRTTNCFSREQCPLLHIPANKNIDAQIWMKMNKEQPTAVSTAKSK